MRKLMILLVLVALGAVSCGQSVPAQVEPTPTHPLLEGLDPPPLNQPLVAPKPIPLDKLSPQLPEDDLPALLVLLGERPFSGTFRETGRLNISHDIIELQPAEGEPLRILYRMPQEMVQLPESTLVGRVDVAEFSGPQGANRSVMVYDKQALLFAEVWQSLGTPLTVGLGDKLRLSQGETRPRDRNGGYTETKLGVFDGEELVTTIPIGKPTTVETRVGAFQVFVEVSHLFSSRKSDLGQYPDTYILHFWIVGLR